MDLIADRGRRVTVEELNTSQLLAHARKQAVKRKFDEMLIVDVDAHHYENEHYDEVFDYIESPVIRREAKEGKGRRTGWLNSQVGYQNTGGRIHRSKFRGKEKAAPGKHKDIVLTLDWMDAMGVDYCCMFPTPMLFLGLHPQVEVEAAMCDAYNAWLCERILAQEPRIVSMLYLPFNDPDAAYKTVKKFGDKKGVVGFMVTSPRYKPVHDNAYIKTYALLEEMGKPISFHAAYSWEDRALQMTNRFISVHALGFMWFNMIHMTNWVINGLPVRFPKLKVLWIESGLTWASGLMQRLDHDAGERRLLERLIALAVKVERLTAGADFRFGIRVQLQINAACARRALARMIIRGGADAATRKHHAGLFKRSLQGLGETMRIVSHIIHVAEAQAACRQQLNDFGHVLVLAFA